MIPDDRATGELPPTDQDGEIVLSTLREEGEDEPHNETPTQEVAKFQQVQAPQHVPDNEDG